MLKKYLLLLSIILLAGCSSAPLIKVYWDGHLIKDVNEINYLYWSEGVQFFIQHRDSVSVNIAGFSHENFIYILVSLANDTDRPVTYFPQRSILRYASGKDSVELKPIRPKNLDKSHFSFFNTFLVGAGNISRLFINLPVDLLIPSNKEEDPIQNIGEEYHDEDVKITKKIFISTHTVYPENKFAGFLVFEYDDDLEINDNRFALSVYFDGKDFNGTGTFEK